MNKDQLQTIKNLIEHRSLIGHFPEDIWTQERFDRHVLNAAIEDLLCPAGFMFSRTLYQLKVEKVITFYLKNHEIILKEYQDYLRALEMVLEDTLEEDIAELYLERLEEPNYNHVDTSILSEPLEFTTYIEYVEGTSIAYFNEVDEDDIKRIEQNVLELLEKEITND